MKIIQCCVALFSANKSRNSIPQSVLFKECRKFFVLSPSLVCLQPGICLPLALGITCTRMVFIFPLPWSFHLLGHVPLNLVISSSREEVMIMFLLTWLFHIPEWCFCLLTLVISCYSGVMSLYLGHFMF